MADKKITAPAPATTGNQHLQKKEGVLAAVPVREISAESIKRIKRECRLQGHQVEVDLLLKDYDNEPFKAAVWSLCMNYGTFLVKDMEIFNRDFLLDFIGKYRQVMKEISLKKWVDMAGMDTRRHHIQELEHLPIILKLKPPVRRLSPLRQLSPVSSPAPQEVKTKNPEFSRPKEEEQRPTATADRQWAAAASTPRSYSICTVIEEMNKMRA